MSHLRAIAQVGQAAVTLAATPPSDFQLRIGFIDGTGRAAVSGRLSATDAGELVDGPDDTRAGEQFTLLASILDQLGYALASGPAAKIDELWALKKDWPDAADAENEAATPYDVRAGRASAFERQSLAWMHIRLGVLPKPGAGIPGQWTVDYDSGPVTFTVRPAAIGATGNDWLLRIEEREPCTFLERVERHFQPGSSVRRRRPDGRVRVQFKSAALFQPFTDQTDRT